MARLQSEPHAPPPAGTRKIRVNSATSLLQVSDAELQRMGFLGKALQGIKSEVPLAKAGASSARDAPPQLLRPVALVMVPTTDLAWQVEQVAASLATDVPDFRVVALGKIDSFQLERKKMAADLDLLGDVTVLVTTPKRLLSYLSEDSPLIDLSGIKHVVLDECDRLLSLGNLPDRGQLFQPKTIFHPFFLTCLLFFKNIYIHV